MKTKYFVSSGSSDCNSVIGIAKWILLFTFSFFLSPCDAQIPQGFNYQAIARDNSGNPVVGETIDVKLGIQADTSASPVILWEEVHTGIKTNAFGLFVLVLGNGTKSGGTAATFSDVNWSVTPLYLKTQIYYKSAWKYMGSSKLLSVPYALRAKDSDQWTTSGSNIYRTTGNVGIGTSTPGAKLHVTGDARLNTSIVGDGIELQQYSTGNRYSGIDFHGDDTYTDYALRILRYNTGPDAASSIVHRGLGELNLSTQDAAPISFYTTNIHRMIIAANGNVGIGTTAPTAVLNPYKTIGDGLNNSSEVMNLTIKPTFSTHLLRFYGIRKIAGSSWNDVSLRIQQRVDATDMGYIEFNPGSGAQDLAFGTSNTERLRISGAGNVGIGTSNPGTYKLNVTGGSVLVNDGTGYGGVLKFSGHGTIASADWGNLTLSTGSNSGNAAIYLNTENATRLIISGSGNVGIGVTSTPTGKMVIQPPTTWDDNVPLFEVKNKSGEQVFAIYNNGIRAYVQPNSAKGLKGGFAIGGFDPTKAGPVDLMTVSPDSIRFSIDNGTGKGQKGGFAIGSFDNTKGGINQEFMYVTPQTSGNGQYNTYIGHLAGSISGVLAANNVFMGVEAGKMNVSGTNNTLIGYQAGYSNTYSWNTCIGTKAGYSNIAPSNTFIGEESGYSNTSGTLNTFLGMTSGKANVDGSGNTFLGNGAGANNISGVSNTSVGQMSGLNITGSQNVILGSQALPLNNSGSDNVAIGFQAGYQNTAGSGNVFLGNKAGRNETGSNKLMIANSTTGNPLISGDFASDYVVINGIANNGLTFCVNGTSGGWSAWTNLSDARMKTKIAGIPDALNRVMQLRGVNYMWKDSLGFDDALHIGFLAQEVEKILPEVVLRDAKTGVLSMQYAPVTALIVEAVKEQQRQIEGQKRHIESQDEKIARLEKMVEDMQALLEKNSLK